MSSTTAPGTPFFFLEVLPGRAHGASSFVVAAALASLTVVSLVTSPSSGLSAVTIVMAAESRDFFSKLAILASHPEVLGDLNSFFVGIEATSTAIAPVVTLIAVITVVTIVTLIRSACITTVAAVVAAAVAVRIVVCLEIRKLVALDFLKKALFLDLDFGGALWGKVLERWGRH